MRLHDIIKTRPPPFIDIPEDDEQEWDDEHPYRCNCLNEMWNQTVYGQYSQLKTFGAGMQYADYDEIQTDSETEADGWTCTQCGETPSEDTFEYLVEG